MTAANVGVPSLAVTKSGNGNVSSADKFISCGSKCSANYDLNATVTLTAAPASGSVFAGWGGACAPAGTAPVCTVTMSGAQDVTASFVAPPPAAPVVLELVPPAMFVLPDVPAFVLPPPCMFEFMLPPVSPDVLAFMFPAAFELSFLFPRRPREFVLPAFMFEPVLVFVPLFVFCSCAGVSPDSNSSRPTITHKAIHIAPLLIMLPPPVCTDLVVVSGAAA
jgi:hypothetical protein